MIFNLQLVPGHTETSKKLKRATNRTQVSSDDDL